MPKIATLSDIESNGPTITTDGNGNLLCRTGNTTWSLNVLLWAGLMVAANILHPPAIIMFLLNGVLLMLNLNAVRVAGQRDTPMWLWVIIVLQVLITLQYGSYFHAEAGFSSVNVRISCRVRACDSKVSLWIWLSTFYNIFQAYRNISWPLAGGQRERAARGLSRPRPHKDTVAIDR